MTDDFCFSQRHFSLFSESSQDALRPVVPWNRTDRDTKTATDAVRMPFGTLTTSYRGPFHNTWTTRCIYVSLPPHSRLFPEIAIVIHSFDERLDFRHGFVGIEDAQIDDVAGYDHTRYLELCFQLISAM